MPTSIQQFDARTLAALAIPLLVALWLFWAVARKIVRIGFFLIALAIGVAVAAGISLIMGKPQPWPNLLAEGMAFAVVWSAIRAKVARIVTAIAIVLMIRLALGGAPSWLHKMIGGDGDDHGAKSSKSGPESIVRNLDRV